MNTETKWHQDEAFRLCASDFFQKVVINHCNLPERLEALRQPDLRIHPRDQMLLHSLVHHQDANASFSQYYNVALQQFYAADQIIQLLTKEPSKLEIMDFACGYGRLLRFLVPAYPNSGITASEIQPDALEFVSNVYQIPTILSCVNPDDFNPGKQFDVIWVASLFSHLPANLFSRWLKKLHSCLTSGGILCFSVHDACLVPNEHQFPEHTGILFFPSSENEDLETSIYGTTYVNEAFVKDTLSSTVGNNANYFRLPRALAHEQDIYILSADQETNLAPLSHFRRGAWGWVDERYINEEGNLYLRGWAASVDDGNLDYVDIRVDDQAFRIPTGLPRLDVGAFFKDSRMDNSGWEFNLAIAAGNQPINVTVSARTARNEKALLFAGEFQRSALRDIEPTSLTPLVMQSPGLWSRLHTSATRFFHRDH